MVIRLWPLTGNSAGNFVGVASAADFVAWVLGLSTSFNTPGLFIGGRISISGSILCYPENRYLYIFICVRMCGFYIPSVRT